jgi:hypothetical protein
VKSVTIQINDLLEFEGQPIPSQRPDNAVIEAMARRQFGFLKQPLQVEIGANAVTVSFAEESQNAQDEALRLAERAGKRAAETDPVVVENGELFIRFNYQADIEDVSALGFVPTCPKSSHFLSSIVFDFYEPYFGSVHYAFRYENKKQAKK